MIAAAGKRMRCKFDAGFHAPAAELAASDGYLALPVSG